MRSALFLGAGASHFVSHPTTKELLNEVQKRVQNLDMQENKRRFVQQLLKEPELDDIEKVYDCIIHTIEIGNYYSSIIANQMRYILNIDIDYKTIVETLKELRFIIRDTLLDSFKIELKDMGEIKKMYDGIWSIMQGSGSSVFQIITTNYDQVIERYCDEDWELVNGFRFTTNLQLNDWRNKWGSDTDKPHLYLVKLHGSIAWQRESGKIVQTDVTGRRTSDDDIMILPTLGPKYYEKSPFRELRDRFKEILSDIDVLVVIGFSYRDPEINGIIKNRLKGGMVVVSVSPEPDQIKAISDISSESVKIKGLPFSKFGANVFAYKKEFGPKTLDDIRNALNVIYKERRDIRN